MTGKIAAIVPAAGESRRMGRPKLTLPIDGVPLIALVIAALHEGGTNPVIVIAPHAEVVGSADLIHLAQVAGADLVVIPDVQPLDMRASFELGMRSLAGRPVSPAMVLLVPADSPGLTATLVAEVVAYAREHRDRIVVPTFSGRRGHPIALPWAFASEVATLPDNVGINALVQRHLADVIELPVNDAGALADLDTPDDYRRWSGRGPGSVENGPRPGPSGRDSEK